MYAIRSYYAQNRGIFQISNCNSSNNPLNHWASFTAWLAARVITSYSIHYTKLYDKLAPMKKPLKKDRTRILIAKLLKRIEALEGERASKRTPSANHVVRVPTPAMFTGKRGSFQFLASKIESYADISNVARDKWVAVALQCMDRITSYNVCYTKLLRKPAANK